MTESASAPDNFKLIIEDDEGRRSVVPIELGEITVGRDEVNTIRLNERNVSRQHARLFKDNGSIYAEDLDSYNGVFINGDRVKSKQPILEGDLLKVGDFKIELRGEGMVRRTEETTQRTVVQEDEKTNVFNADATESGKVSPMSPSDLSEFDDEDDEEGEEGEEERNEPTAIIRVDHLNDLEDKNKNDSVGAAAGPAVRPRLVCVSTQFAGTEFAVANDESVIGRTEDNDISVDHRSVSRHHAKIVASGNSSFRIIDMKSANGTLVNGEEYAQIELKRGDLIELGHVKFRFVPSGESYRLSPEEEQAVQRAKGGTLPQSAPAMPDFAPAEAQAPLSSISEPRASSGPSALLIVGITAIAVLLVAVLYVLISGTQRPTTTPPIATMTPTTGGNIQELTGRMADAVLQKDWPQAKQIADTILLLEPGQVHAAKVKERASDEIESKAAYNQAIRLSTDQRWADVLEALSMVKPETEIAAKSGALREQATEGRTSELVAAGEDAIRERRYDDVDAVAKKLIDLDAKSEADALSTKAETERSKRAGSKTSTPRPKVTTAKPTKTEPEAPKEKPAPEPAPSVTKSADDHYQEAVAHIKRDEPNKAVEPLRACIKADTSSCQCYRAMGIAYAKMRNAGKASRYYKMYLENCPDAADADAVRKLLGE